MEFPECFDKGLFRNFLKVGKSKNPLEPLLEIFIELHPEDAARAFESLNAEQELHLFHHSVELHCRLDGYN